MRRRLRWLGTSAVALGVVGVLWVVLTLAWQEPVSGISAAREQKRLRRELGPTPPRPVAPTAVGGERARRRLAALARRAHGQIRIGDAFGRIEIPALDREYAVIEGADRERLRTGPGHYEDTPFPGEPGTVGVAGHRTTYGAPFRRIDRLEPGDGIVVTVSYARFVYRVERTRAVFPRDVEVKRPVGYDQLIVSASHPPYSARQRLVVFARLVRAEAPGILYEPAAPRRSR